MKRKYPFIVSIFLAVIAAVCFYLMRTPEISPKGAKDARAVETVPNPSTSDEFSSGASLDQTKPVSPTTSTDDKGEYRCPYLQEDRCKGDPLIASTETEARWLKYFGYPSAQRLDDLERMSLQELESLSNSGDLPARVVLGEKLIDSGKVYEGRGVLDSALINGSIYAAYEYARSQKPELPGSSQSEAMAYYRLAYLFGDKKASFELYRTTPSDFLDAGTMNGVDERAMELYRNLLKERAKRGMNMRLWPRP